MHVIICMYCTYCILRIDQLLAKRMIGSYSQHLFFPQIAHKYILKCATEAMMQHLICTVPSNKVIKVYPKCNGVKV